MLKQRRTDSGICAEIGRETAQGVYADIMPNRDPYKSALLPTLKKPYFADFLTKTRQRYAVFNADKTADFLCYTGGNDTKHKQGKQKCRH